MNELNIVNEFCCFSYGSRLVTIKDQYENDLLGTMVDNMAGSGEEYYIGKHISYCMFCTVYDWIYIFLSEVIAISLTQGNCFQHYLFQFSISYNLLGEVDNCVFFLLLQKILV